MIWKKNYRNWRLQHFTDKSKTAEKGVDMSKTQIKNQIIVTVIFLIIISSNIQPIFAEIFFPTTNFRLQSTPTYCVVIPNDPISEEQKMQWVNLVKDAALDWEKKLKEKELVNNNLWNIDVNIVSEDEAEGCGINIYFKDKPSLTGNIVGFFTWPPGSITIYYLQLEVCDLFTCYSDDTFISNDTTYAVALHELGHTFGLDHYISDNAGTNSQWQSSNNVPPSIMIPSIHNNPSLQEITDIDVSKVREIYGSDGFYAFSTIPIPEPTIPVPTIPDPTPIPDPIPIPVPEIIEPIIPDKPFTSTSVSEKIIEVQNQNQQIVKVSGRVSEDKLLRGHPVIMTVYNPDQTIQILKTAVTNDGYFETLIIFDKKSIRGIYEVSMSYIERVDKSKDVSFEIVDKKTIVPEIILDTEDAGSLSEPNIPNQIETKSDEKIPQWVKNNAGWWADKYIDDSTFIEGIEFLISNGIIDVPKHTSSQSGHQIPDWIKNNARWWSEGNISDTAFIEGIEFLVKIGIIKVS